LFLVLINNDFRDDKNTKNQLKRFENICTQDPECLQIIKTTWEEEDEEIHMKLNSVMNKVHKWGKATHGNIPIEIKATQSKIQVLRAVIPSEDTMNQIHQLEIKLDGLIRKEEQW
jgi:hypothetical protein